MRRPTLAPQQGIDWTLTRSLWNGSAAEKPSAPSKRHMLALAGGGHWRQHRVHAIDTEQSELCLLCGKGRDDDDHIWECESLQHLHSKHERILRCKDHLPAALKRYGLAPHVITDATQLLWGGRGEALSHSDARWMGRGIGLDSQHESLTCELARGKSTIYELLQSIAKFEPFPKGGWYTGSVGPCGPGGAIKQSQPYKHGPAEGTCGPLPDAPNVFSDGSVRPSRPAWLTHAAIWAILARRATGNSWHWMAPI